MIRLWLESKKRKSHLPRHIVFDICEKDITGSEEKLNKFIAKKILTHLIEESVIIRRFKKKDPEKLEKYIIENVIPSGANQPSKNVRQGDWAEIISAEILKSMNNATLPIHKLRWKANRDQAMQGTDILACDFTDKPLIIFTEVKSKIINITPSEAKRISEGAFKSILATKRKTPEIIDFVSKRLLEISHSNYELVDFFDEATIEPSLYSRRFQIFFVVQKGFWNEECLNIIDEAVKKLSNITINIVLIDSLRELIENTYSMTPEIAKEVVYE